MRSFLSVTVLAAALSLLVPDNGAQAVNAAAFGMGVAQASQAVASAPSTLDRLGDREAPVDSNAAMLLAFGFLGAVMARRLRAD